MKGGFGRKGAIGIQSGVQSYGGWVVGRPLQGPCDELSRFVWSVTPYRSMEINVV